MTDSRALSIVHAIARLNVGGAARSVLELAAEQQRRGHRVVVVAGTLAAGEESMEYVADNLGVAVIHLPALQRELAIRADTIAVRELRRTIRRRRPDVVHTHTAKAGATGRIAAMVAGPARPEATVHTFHGHVLRGYFDTRRERVFVYVERTLARHTGALVAVSDEVRDDLVELGVAPRERIDVIPYGFDLSHLHRADASERAARRIELGLEPEQFVVGFAGRLTPIKRPLDLIRTLAALRASGVDGALVIVGDGQDRRAAEHLAGELGIAASCRFLGFQRDIGPWLGAFDAFLLTSENEGTPVVAIEALAAGCPVVATDAGGTATVVRDGRTGYLVGIGDTSGLAAHLASLAHDPAGADEMGRAGATDTRNRFTTVRMADAHRCSLREAAPAVRKVLHIHKITGIGGSERHLLTLLPALRAHGMDARFLGLDVQGTDTRRFYAALDEVGVPHRSVRCTFDANPRMAAAVIRAVRDERPSPAAHPPGSRGCLRSGCREAASYPRGFVSTQ